MTSRPFASPSALVPAALVLVTALGLPALARAQQFRMTPGLWEQTMTMKSGSGEMEAKMAEAQQQMANMPPEQRKMVEQMMASRGVKMGANGTTLRFCVSKEMAARDATPPKESGCEQQQVERSGATVKYRFSCAGRDGRPPTTGEGTFTMTSATSFTGNSVVNTVEHGKPERMEMSMAGRYLGADCGDIAPARPAGR